jgi:hypothetical protein
VGRTVAELQSLLDQHAVREEQGVFAVGVADLGSELGELDRALRDHIMREWDAVAAASGEHLAHR